jgi:hypothetical protein
LALINSQHVQHVDIPHEPGQWIEIRPVTAGQVADLQKDSVAESSAAVAIKTLVGCIVAWSYEAPVSIESLRELDYETFQWLETQISVTSGLRSEDQKKDLNSPSSRRTGRGRELSPTSSGT